MRKALFMSVLAGILSSGCASYGFPGFEAAGVVAGNQALVNTLGAQAQAALQPGFAIAGLGNVPICRLQDLDGVPAVSQPVLVRVGKSKGHRVADIVAGAAIVGGTVYLGTRDGMTAAAGAGAGAGGGLLLSNHEYDLCVFVPVPVAPAASPAPAPVQPPAPPVEPDPPAPQTQPGVLRVRV